MASGKATPLACKEAGITTQTYYRWRKEYGGLKMEQAKRMKQLEKEDTRLRRSASSYTRADGSMNLSRFYTPSLRPRRVTKKRKGFLRFGASRREVESKVGGLIKEVM